MRIGAVKRKVTKLWLIVLFTIIPFLSIAQDPGEPCDDIDPLDNTCPLDNQGYVLILVIIMVVFAFLSLKKANDERNQYC